MLREMEEDSKRARERERERSYGRERREKRREIGEEEHAYRKGEKVARMRERERVK